MPPAWLPALIGLNQFGGNWDQYLDAIYARFRTDFVGVAIQYEGKTVGLKRHPVERGREATFWHLTSEGKTEADRVPDLRRCERIGWPRAILDNCQDPCLKSWVEDVRGDSRIHILCEDAQYLFVLSDRGHYVLPWTAFHIDQPHRLRRLIKRWEAAQG